MTILCQRNKKNNRNYHVKKKISAQIIFNDFFGIRNDFTFVEVGSFSIKEHFKEQNPSRKIEKDVRFQCAIRFFIEESNFDWKIDDGNQTEKQNQ